MIMLVDLWRYDIIKTELVTYMVGFFKFAKHILTSRRGQDMSAKKKVILKGIFGSTPKNAKKAFQHLHARGIAMCTERE